MMDDDDDLKGAFRELRASDAERTPPMDALLQKHRRKRGIHAAFVLVPSFAVLASAAAIALFVGSMKTRAAAAPVVVVMASAVAPAPPPVMDDEPLGFLLETPSFGTPDFDSDPGGPR